LLNCNYSPWDDPMKADTKPWGST